MDEDELEKKYQQLATLVEYADEAIIGIDLNRKITVWNRGAERLYGYTAGEMIGAPTSLLIPRELEGEALLMRERVMAGEQATRCDTIRLRKDGSGIIVSLTHSAIRDAEGRIVGTASTARDITEIKRAEEALRESEKKYRVLFDNEIYAICIFDPETLQTLDANDAMARLCGYSRDKVLSLRITDITAELEAPNALLDETIETHVTKIPERFIRKSNGTVIPVEAVSYPHEWNGRKVVFLILRDISERKQVEEELAVSEEREDSPIGIVFLGARGEITLTNQRYRDFLGMNDAEILKRGPVGIVHPDDWEPSIVLTDKLRSGEVPAFHREQRYARGDGTVVWADTYITALRDQDGRFIHTIGWVQNITERKLTDEALRESEARNRAIMDSALDAIITIDNEGKVTYWNQAAEGILGYESHEAIGRNLHELIAPDRFLSAYRAAFPEFQRSGGGEGIGTTSEMAARRKDGREITVTLSLSSMRIKGTWHAVGIVRDTTDQKRAEQEKAKLQEQLSQAQKMESVGRLAGGVAHDFNNMLGVILGRAEMALEQVDQSQPIHEDLVEIQKAASRSADLTHKLLSFARRETVAPKVRDLNEIIAGTLKMLQRLIREDISVEYHPQEGLWLVKVDPSQIDQILANLCVNARDAIDGIGRIGIETANISLKSEHEAFFEKIVPGDYVLLTVSDSGCGMNAETLSHLFEPFFTTKGVGRGTGLGLATVYGAVKQNRGYIDVASRPDQGTTFSIYLPRHAEKAVLDRPGEPSLFARGHETILLVEDEPANLRLTALMLQKQGYTVLAAGTPNEAVRVAKRRTGEIHLLITDVVMPGMNGRDLSKRLLQLCPNLSCLFMSGYTADVITRNGVLDEGMHFLQKPFSREALVTKVRLALSR